MTENNKLILLKTSADKIIYSFTVLKYIIVDIWESIRSKKYYRRTIENDSISDTNDDIN